MYFSLPHCGAVSLVVFSNGNQLEVPEIFIQNHLQSAGPPKEDLCNLCMQQVLPFLETPVPKCDSLQNDRVKLYETFGRIPWVERTGVQVKWAKVQRMLFCWRRGPRVKRLHMSWRTMAVRAEVFCTCGPC